MFRFIRVLTHTLLIFIILICVLFFILLSTFRACMDHYFALWRHTQFLFKGFSSVFLCACVCCSVTVLTKWVAPRGPLTNFNDKGGGGGGPTEVYISYPKKSQLQNLPTQKIYYFF